jgi:CelD/BcsL family acetyltransferase involved in cellulose biosynthesis
VTPGQGMPIVAVGDRSIGTYLSRNARSAENKARNRLTRDGRTLTERWVTDPEDVGAAVPGMSAIHRARDRQLGRVSDHDDPRRARFYAEVLTEHADRGELDLLLVEIDATLAAYVAAFRDGRTLRVWDNRVSPEWADYSAGRLANHAAIRRVVLDGDYDVLDWMRGEESYKLSSATEIIATSTLEAWSSPVARAPYAAKDAGGRLLRRLPAMDRAVRQARGKHGQTGHSVDSDGA